MRRREALQRFLFAFVDADLARQREDFENLAQERADLTQDQSAAQRLDLVVQGDELAEQHRGHALDLAEVEHEFATAAVFGQPQELLANNLNGLFFEEAATREAGDGDVGDGFDFEPGRVGS